MSHASRDHVATVDFGLCSAKSYITNMNSEEQLVAKWLLNDLAILAALQSRAARRTSSITLTDSWELVQKVCFYRYRSSLEFESTPLKIQSSAAKQTTSFSLLVPLVYFLSKRFHLNLLMGFKRHCFVVYQICPRWHGSEVLGHHQMIKHF